MEAGGTPNLATTPASSRMYAGSTVHLHHTSAAYALRQILVRRADDHAFDARVASCRLRRRGQCIIGLELDHGPYRDAGRRERIFKQWELASRSGSMPSPVLYPGHSPLRKDSIT